MNDKKTLNEKLGEFNHLLDWFYSDEFDLGVAEVKYKEAIDMAKEIRQDLDGLKNRIEILSEDFTK